ncbi:MAG: biotin transporter BioY [Spirochaetes bacterium]|nr:biotin transporter BioY [Spirochaetota bacterium]
MLYEKYDAIRFNCYSWRYNSSILIKFGLTILMAALTGLMAQLKIYLPWSPVPITGQTLAAVFSGVLLGSYWGGLSFILYIIIGIAGTPWFAGAKSGLSVILGPTGGYLLGFVLVSFFMGYITENNVNSRKILPLLIIMFFANFILIYTPGLIQLSFWYKAVKGTDLSLNNLLMMGLIPFIIGDIFKILIAAGLTTIIMPKKDYRKL